MNWKISNCEQAISGWKEGKNNMIELLQDEFGGFCHHCVTFFKEGHQHSQEECADYQRFREQKKKEAERNRTALFMRAGNRDYGSSQYPRM